MGSLNRPGDITRAFSTSGVGGSEHTANAEEQINSALSKQGTIEDHHPESSMEGAIYETDGAESTRPGHLKDGRIKIKEEQDSTDLADIPTLATASNTTKGKGTEKRKATIVSLSPGDDNEDEDEDEDEDDDDNGETGNGSDNKDTTAGQPSLSRRGRSSKVTKSQLAQKSESVRAKQPTRKPPGRPSKNAAAVSSSVNRKRSTTMKADKVESPRRSLRAAAESASINIAEQSGKRPKVSAPAVPASTSPTPKRQRKGVVPSARQAKTGKQEWEVQKIVNSRLNKKTGTIEYQVKWDGFSASENTWEPAENLTHCGQKLAQYQSAQKRK